MAESYPPQTCLLILPYLGKISGSILLFFEKVVTMHGQQLLVSLLGAKNINLMLPQSSILGFVKDNDTAFLSIKFGHHLMQDSTEKSCIRSMVCLHQVPVNDLWLPTFEPSTKM